MLDLLYPENAFHSAREDAPSMAEVLQTNIFNMNSIKDNCKIKITHKNIHFSSIS